MNTIIDECRLQLGGPPRSLALRERLRFRALTPMWVRLSGDAMARYYDDQHLLRDRGRVVWGHIVQANSLLFRPGWLDSPANAIYDPTPAGDRRYLSLEVIARRIFALKGRKHHDEDLDECARWVTDERARFMNAVVPEALSEGRRILFTTLMVHRKRLPARYLSAMRIPLIINPQETPTAMILPCDYWPEGVSDLGK